MAVKAQYDKECDYEEVATYENPLRSQREPSFDGLTAKGKEIKLFIPNWLYRERLFQPSPGLRSNILRANGLLGIRSVLRGGHLKVVYEYSANDGLHHLTLQRDAVHRSVATLGGER